MRSLNAKTWAGFMALAAIMGLVLFLSAGTIRYWQGWGYLAIFFGPSLYITLYLMKRNPGLLEHRLRGGPTAEKLKEQRIIMSIASMGFIGILVVPALDYRFHWTHLSITVEILGFLVLAVSFWVMFLVYWENPFASATIEILDNQQVISTGPYAIVRHPMYAGGSLLFIGTPLALGSLWGLAPFVIALPALIWRLLDEERFLSTHLPGYAEYCAKVRWRLIPGIF